MLKTALSSLVANMYIPALYKRLQDTVLGTLIFQVTFLQSRTHAENSNKYIPALYRRL